MSLLYCNSFKCSDGELKNFPEFSDSNSSRRQQVHGYTGGGDYGYVWASSLAVESMSPRFMPSCNRADDLGSQILGVFGEGFVKQETTESESEFCDGSSPLYRNQEVRSLPGHNSVITGVGTAIDSSFSFMNSTEIESSQLSSRNFSNLVRQTSCPTEFSNILAVENGFSKTTNLRSFGSYNVTNVNPSGQLNFSNELPLASKRMHEISEVNMVSDDSDAHDLRNGSNQPHVTSFLNNYWDDSDFRSLKRARENSGISFSTSNSLEYKSNTESRSSSIHGLTHHLSLPKTFSEVASKEKLFQFQDAVPCKIRAKRGCATHPRSIAERVRRTRISERMRKLQDLFPDMDKQTSIADMLDWAVEHIKDLQRQVQNLSDSSAKCSCST